MMWMITVMMMAHEEEKEEVTPKKKTPRYNWARENKNGAKFIVKMFQENGFVRSKNLKDLIFEEGVKKHLWDPGMKWESRVFSKVDI
jgi:hypothetical protein